MRALPAALACALCCAPVLASAADSAPVSAPASPPSSFGMSLLFSAALDNPAFATSIGGRFRPDEGWLLGVDVEWNPWASIPALAVRPGAMNLYATGIHRWNMRAEYVKLRSTGHLGASVLLFDLYGAPAGSAGPYVGLSLLGLEIRVARGLYLIVDPADVSIPVPQIRGAPLTYRQYRFTLGVQIGG